jgi:hypothetical protein
MDVGMAGFRFSSVTSVILAILLLSAGCTEKEPAVVVDDRWSVDYAKNGCSMRAITEEPCVGDPVAEVRRFEAQLGTFFAGDPSCQGVVLAGYQGPDSAPSRARSAADWQLTLDFIVGEASQSWSLIRYVDRSYDTGNGNPREIAHTICAVVRQARGRRHAQLTGAALKAASSSHIYAHDVQAVIESFDERAGLHTRQQRRWRRADDLRSAPSPVHPVEQAALIGVAQGAHVLENQRARPFNRWQYQPLARAPAGDGFLEIQREPLQEVLEATGPMNDQQIHPRRSRQAAIFP